jgi:hypothetical protein
MKFITLFFLLVFLTGCAAQTPDGPKQAGPTPSQAPSLTSSPSTRLTASATISPTARATVEDFPFLVYTRSGGFAGVNETWEIFSDGRVLSDKGDLKMISPAAAQALLEQMRAVDLAKLSQKSPTSEVCADCFMVELTLNDGGKQIHISIIPESTNADPIAVKLVGTVQKTINSAR